MPDVFDEEAFAKVRRQRAESAEHTENLPLSVRVAGGIMLANGILQLVLQTIESASADATTLAGPWTASFDIVVGGVLLSNQPQVWHWARVRVVLLGAALALLHLLLGQAFDASLQLCFCAGLFLLLGRGAAPARLTAGIATSVIAIVLALFSAGPFLGWTNPFGRLRGRLNGELGDERAFLVGSAVGYHLDLSPGHWHTLHLPDDENDAAETPRPASGPRYEISPAVRRPEVLVDLRLFALQAPPDAFFDESEVMTTLVNDARDNLPEFLVTEDEWHEGAYGPTRVLEGQARIDGQRAAVAVGLKVDGACVFMLIGTSPARMYDRVRDDVLEIYRSLQATGC